MAKKKLPNIGNNIHYLISGQQTLMDPQGSFLFVLFVFVFFFKSWYRLGKRNRLFGLKGKFGLFENKQQQHSQ